MFVLLLAFASCKKSDNNNSSNLPPAVELGVGKSARDLLSSEKYRALNVEILYMPGFAPEPGTISNLRSFLAIFLNKPGGITVTQREIAGSGQTLGVDGLKDIESKNRTAFYTDTIVPICIIYTDGKYTDANVLGVAYRNTSAALFGKTIQQNSSSFSSSARVMLQSTVLQHEVGHLLGLVDLGSPMQSAHEDASHDGHCNNSNCLMYYAAETTDLLGMITGTVPHPDAACSNDLKANGGK